MWTNTKKDMKTNTYTNTNTTVTMRGGWTWLTDKLTKDIREWCGLLHFTLLTTPHLTSHLGATIVGFCQTPGLHFLSGHPFKYTLTAHAS